MDQPSTVADAIQRARAALRADSAYDLGLGYRQAIGGALGPYVYDVARTLRDGPFDMLAGYRRRARLEILAVRHALPLWRARWPREHLPARLIEEAEAVLRGEANRAEASWVANKSRSLLDNFSAANHDNPVVLLGYAAHDALCVALDDRLMLDERPDYSVSNLDMDIYGMDASLLAAIAYAGGAPGNARSDPAKRLAFWEWWLDEAVPAAWASVPTEA